GDPQHSHVLRIEPRSDMSIEGIKLNEIKGDFQMSTFRSTIHRLNDSRRTMTTNRYFGLPLFLSMAILAVGLYAQAVLPKAAVGEKIRMVEDGVDKFRDY